MQGQSKKPQGPGHESALRSIFLLFFELDNPRL